MNHQADVVCGEVDTPAIEAEQESGKEPTSINLHGMVEQAG